MTARVTLTSCSARAPIRSSAYVQTPPTASAVISTWRTLVVSRGAAPPSTRRMGIGLEGVERAGLGILDVAEFAEAGQVVVDRALPGVIVGRAPAPQVVGRTGIRKQRHRLVGPDAIGDQP